MRRPQPCSAHNKTATSATLQKMRIYASSAATFTVGPAGSCCRARHALPLWLMPLAEPLALPFSSTSCPQVTVMLAIMPPQKDAAQSGEHGGQQWPSAEAIAGLKQQKARSNMLLALLFSGLAVQPHARLPGVRAADWQVHAVPSRNGEPLSERDGLSVQRFGGQPVPRAASTNHAPNCHPV